MVDRDELLKKINEMPIDELQALICKALDDSGIAYSKGGDGISLSDFLKIDPMYKLKPYMLMREMLKDAETIPETKEGWRMTELKPCPFCGYRHITIERIEYTCQEDSIWFALCHGCGARSGDATESKEQAIKMWNRRADNG